MDKILLEFNLEKINIEEYVTDQSFQEFKKLIKNYMIDKYNSKEYDKAEAWKEILEHLFFLEQKNTKKSWHLL